MSHVPVQRDYPRIAVRVTVARGASEDAASRYDTYVVHVASCSNVLQLLAELRSQCDGAFSYPMHFCKLGSCGVCALRVNGRSVLACRSLVTGEELRIEPLPGRRVLTDLLTVPAR